MITIVNKKHLIICFLTLTFLFFNFAFCSAKEYSFPDLNCKVNLPEEWIIAPNTFKDHQVTFLHCNSDNGYDSSLVIRSSLNKSGSVNDLSDQEIIEIANSTFEYINDNSKRIIENKVIQINGHKASFLAIESNLNNTRLNRILTQFSLGRNTYTIYIITLGTDTYDNLLPEIMEMLNTFNQYQNPAESV